MDAKQLNELFKSLSYELDVPAGRLRREYDDLMVTMTHRRCIAKGKPLPIYAKPYFLTQQQVQRFEGAVNTILDCQEKVINLYFKDYHFRHLFELTDNEKPLVAIPHGLSRHIHFSRLDAILTSQAARFLEFNCDSPGGACYSDIQTELLMRFSVVRELSKRVTFRTVSYRALVLDTLLKAWHDFGGRDHPTIAVMGNPDVANVEEFKLCAEYFESCGYESFFCDPWSLDYDSSTLSSEGRKIHIIYRRGVLADYSRDPQRAQSVITACRDGNVCMVNPFSAKLGDNKNLLSVLTDERTAFLFSLKERKVLRQYLPWTRMVREGKTDYEGQEIDLIHYIVRHKDSFVIKPNSEYGGRGVVIGNEATQTEWEKAVDDRLHQAKVVQEYVPIPQEEFPVFGEKLTFVPKKFNLNFLTFRGKFGGGFCRASESSIINISAGGALVVLFIIEDGDKTADQ